VAKATMDMATAQFLLQLQERQEQCFRSLAVEFRSSLPQILSERITPSQASGKQAVEFSNLLSRLGLTKYMENATKCFAKIPDGRKEFVYDWEIKTGSLGSISEESSSTMPVATGDFEEEEGAPVHGKTSPAELSSYAPLCKYLQDLGFDAVVVGNGQGLTNRLLYSVQAFSMREQKDVCGQKVHYVTTIEGLTDIVVLDHRGNSDVITRERVKFAIEVKVPSDLKDVSAGDEGPENIMRSVLTQLLGLNINNIYNAPPVLLTNLRRSNFVFYISEHQEYPWFRIARQQCSTLLAGLQFVEKVLALKRCTVDFGRPCSPELRT
jgi:hypothetical protein